MNVDDGILLHLLSNPTLLRSRLARLKVDAPWIEVPAALARLPLTALRLKYCKFNAGEGNYLISAGMPRALKGLAPTLKASAGCAVVAGLPACFCHLFSLHTTTQDLRFDFCKMRVLPIVISSFTNLTCLSLNDCYPSWDGRLPSLPAWLAALTSGLPSRRASGRAGSYPIGWQVG